MKIQTETTPLDRPVIIKNEKGQGVKWWVIQVTPRQWEANLFKLRGERTLSGLNQPHPFTLWDGKQSMSAPKATISFDSDNHVVQAAMNQDTEVSPGVFAAAGSEVHWENQYVSTVDQTSEPFTAESPDGQIVIPKGSTVRFDSSRDHSVLELREKDIHTDDTSQLVKRDSNGNPLPIGIQNPNEEIAISKSGPIAAKGAQIRFDYHGGNAETSISKIAKAFDFGNGVVAAAGSNLNMGARNGKYAWTYVKLAHDVTIKGVLCRAGSDLSVDGGYIRLIDYSSKTSKIIGINN
jgi:hypothetical protein